jgi:predicted signal transduction protein with EAL and GGDEF domain
MAATSFAFLLVDTTTKDAETIAFDLQQSFNNWARQKELAAYAHIGMAVIPHRPIAMDQVLISINAALYRARQYKKGVSGAVFADPEQSR